MSLVATIRRANAPLPADHSVPFRVATTVAVLTGVVAAESVGELSLGLALGSVVAISVGMVFSYLTRGRPWQWVKVLLALAVLCVFVLFVAQIFGAAHTGELSSIEVPLAGLFTFVQVIHAFDVPARRDLLFSLAAAGALITIAAAQASSGTFAVYVAVWIVATIAGLGCSWHSMSGARRAPRPAPLAGSLFVALCVAVGLLVVLPQPRAVRGLTLPASLSSYLPLSGSGLVNGSGAQPTEPAQPGKPGGRIGVGGYLGFGLPLDTADRSTLGNQVVMRVRAERPGYFLGLTYDTWNGQSWLESAAQRHVTTLTGGSPFDLTQPTLDTGPATSDIQTFYVEQPLPNLLFATSDPAQVFFPARSLVLGSDGSLRSPVAITPGTVYTVISNDDEVSPTALAKDRTPITAGLERLAEIRDALQLPYPYPRVKALASSIVRRAGAHTTEAVVAALESWIGRHTEYSTDIPPLLSGQDAVDQFLFVSRRGYCEQISTALAVMLRTLGIPAREAVGYVPGSYDPLSGLYTIEAKDAHAWVQVYFPGYGWQSFDPTAQVPLAPDNPGTVLLHDLFGGVRRLPWKPIGPLAGAGATGYGALSYTRRRRRRPAGWAGQMAARMERLGGRAGLRRRRPETLVEYARRLEVALGSGGLVAAAAALEESAYCTSDPLRVGDRQRVATALRGLSRVTRRHLFHPRRSAASA
jgi:transglutaminase-like putative cysteine protease